MIVEALLKENIVPSEERLLVLAARLDLDAESLDEMDALFAASDLNWDRLLAWGNRLGVLPLLHKHLSHESLSSGVPDSVRASLAEQYRLRSIRNLRFYSLVWRVGKLMRAAGIPVLLLKGAYLAKWVYRDIALRPMSDVDLLCKPEDIQRSADVLGAAGFELWRPEPGTYPSRLHEKMFADYSHHPVSALDPAVGRIEVHQGIMSPFSAAVRDDGGLWDRSAGVVLDGVPFQALCAEDQILHLAEHLYKHATQSNIYLYWFSDLDAVLRAQGPNFDWEMLLRRAERFGVRGHIESVMQLVMKHWNTPGPSFAGRTGLPPLSRIIRDQGAGGVTGETLGLVPGTIDILRLWRRVEGWRSRASYLARLLFPSIEYIRHRYHPSGHGAQFLWYVAHPFIQFVRLGRSVYVNCIRLLSRAPSLARSE